MIEQSAVSTRRHVKMTCMCLLFYFGLNNWIGTRSCHALISNKVYAQNKAFADLIRRKLRSTSENNEASIDGMKRLSPTINESAISESLIEALDLKYIFELLSSYCVTVWGKESMLSILERRRLKFHHDMFRAAESLQCARNEYSLVEEAMILLAQKQVPPFQKWENFDACDDKQWLAAICSGGRNEFHLEYIARTDYILSQIISTFEWIEEMADVEFHTNSLQNLSSPVIMEFQSEMKSLYDKIQNSVIKERPARIIPVLTNENCSQFVLNYKKFPHLANLHAREVALRSDVVISMNRLLSNKDIRSKLSKNPDGSIPRDFIEIEGRLLLPVKPVYAASVGTIRAYSRSKKTCYVEPSKVSSQCNDLVLLRSEIEETEKNISNDLMKSIISVSPTIWRGVCLLGRLDTIFARAAFGVSMHAVAPTMFDEGTINVVDFVHPLLAVRSFSVTDTHENIKSPIPITLQLNTSQCKSGVLISGPNGGGKTAALKSFGVSALLSKLGIPLIASPSAQTRVDFFGNIFGEIGDSQSIIHGKSTLMGRMQSLSSITNDVAQNCTSSSCEYDLLLLDELASGTDPNAGYALSRSILEYILSNNPRICIIGTTHSPQLKSFAVEHEKMTSASVLLDNSDKQPPVYRAPTFKLSYNSIGDSHALAAASRCSFPTQILERASELLGTEDKTFTYIGSLVDALEEEKVNINIMKSQAMELVDDSRKILATASITASLYEKKYARVESRLDGIFRKLVAAEDRDIFEITGTLLKEVKLQRKKIKDESELLRERGLRKIPMNYNLNSGETVVITAEPYDGETALIVQSNGTEVVVSPIFGSSFEIMSFEAESSTSNLVLHRDDLALWDYEGDSNNKCLTTETSRIASFHNLESAFSKISLKLPQKGSTYGGGQQSNTSKVKFKSARARKAQKKAKKKK